MKIIYLGITNSNISLTKDNEYLCCKVRFSISSNATSVTFIVFDDNGFLMPISSEQCKVKDVSNAGHWRYSFKQGTDSIEFTLSDERLDHIGDWDILIDLPCHIADQEETGDDFFDTDAMRDGLDKLRHNIEQGI